MTLQHRDERILLKDLLFFESAFETAKLMVQNWTPQEEVDLIMRQLPARWRTRVLEQEAKDAKFKYAVKITGCPVDAEKLKSALQRLGYRITTADQLAGCIIIKLGSMAEKDSLLRQDLNLNGSKISTQEVRDRWKGRDIFRFLTEKIRVEQ